MILIAYLRKYAAYLGCCILFYINYRKIINKVSLLILFFIPFKHSGTYAISEDLDQMPQNAASDQGLHCLLTEYPIKRGMCIKRLFWPPYEAKK